MEIIIQNKDTVAISFEFPLSEQLLGMAVHLKAYGQSPEPTFTAQLLEHARFALAQEQAILKGQDYKSGVVTSDPDGVIESLVPVYLADLAAKAAVESVRIANLPPPPKTVEQEIADLKLEIEALKNKQISATVSAGEKG